MLNLKIKVLLNRIQYDPTNDLAYIKSYFASRDGGVNITWDIQKVDVHGYNVTSVTNPMGNRQWTMDVNSVNPIVKPFLDTTDDICLFVIQGLKEFGEKAPSECEEKTYIPGTKTVLCVANADDVFYDAEPNFRVWVMHELMHALGTLASYDGHPVSDCMDIMTNSQGKTLYYYLNQTPEDVNSNFTNMWERLYPWLSQKKSPVNQATLKRTSDNGTETIGVMTVGNWSCSTLERPWKNNMSDVSCIPKGTYQCSIQPFHDTSMYELANVPGRTGIFIHSANYFNQLEGCIALGMNPSDINHDGQVDVMSSVATVTAFMALFDKKPFTLVIE